MPNYTCEYCSITETGNHYKEINMTKQFNKFFHENCFKIVIDLKNKKEETDFNTNLTNWKL